MFTPLNSHFIQKLEMSIEYLELVVVTAAVLIWIWLHPGGLMNDVINYAKHVRIYKNVLANMLSRLKSKKFKSLAPVYMVPQTVELPETICPITRI